MAEFPQSARKGVPDDLLAGIAVEQRALERDPADVRALFALARLQMTAGQLAEAAGCYRRLAQAAPPLAAQFPEIRADAARLAAMFAVRGAAAAHGRDAEGAIAAYRTAIDLDAQSPVQAYFALSSLLHKANRPEPALEVLRRACQAHPQRAAAHVQLGKLLYELNRAEEAIAAFRRAVEAAPDAPGPLRQLGDTLIKEGQLDEALGITRRIQRLEPEDPSSISNEAVVLELKGEVRRAHELLLPLARAGRTTTHLVLAFGKVCARLEPPSDEALPLLRSELERGELKAEDRGRLWHTLSALCDALGRTAEAFEALEQAKRIEASQFEDSKEELLAVSERSIACFTRERLARLPRARHGSERPVFIVGMPRSGTSLAEQILASHPQVYGAGELTTIISLARTALGTFAAYPQCLEQWTQARVEEGARYFLAQLARLAPAALRVTDKMPFNFLHLGMIELLFPQARVIHCSRDALDTLVSCYFMEFSPKLSIFNDLGTLGRYYRGYRKLMRHWRGALSLPVFELRYEELLAEPERVVRQMVGFCGLEWDDACMKFHQSERHVKTFSYHQVRKPLYTSSVGRYKAYAAHLGPLIEAIGDELEEPAVAAAVQG